MVYVDGIENARWLLDQLARSFVFRSARPILQEQASTICMFQVPRNSMLPYSRFEKLLAAIPRVILLEIRTDD
jgi:hypothetical protein